VGRNAPDTKWHSTKNEDRARKVVSITLDERVLERLDAAALKLGIKRSGAVEEAVLEWLQKKGKK
jgi:metal-responsive CopG/Arc/MetJ family transcriptional regulator